MSERAVLARARKEKIAGKSAATQAGEFVREEFHHLNQSKRRAHSAGQAIAIGLSKARRAGVRLPPPKKGTVPAAVRHQAVRDVRKGKNGGVI